MKIAISTLVVNKARPDQFKDLNGSFRNVDFSPERLAAHIDSGFSFCAQHSEYRKKANFERAGFLAVDIDRGLHLDDALAMPLVKDFACIVYTTPSHTEDQHRFRIVFELESDISDAAEMRKALSGLILRFSGDGACSDPCRLFFGSKGSKPVILGKVLPRHELAELILRGAEAHGIRADTISKQGGGKRSAIRSRVTVEAGTPVYTEKGGWAPFDSLPVGTRVHCPQHADTSPSAFTLKSQAGNPGVFCSTCCTTFFASDEPPEYDFNYSMKRFLNLTLEEYEAYADEDGHAEISEVRGGRVKVLTREFLPYEEEVAIKQPKRKPVRSLEDLFDWQGFAPGNPLTLVPDVTFVRSPKGTGKTEWLKRLLGDLKRRRLSALLIGHRQALISSTAERLEITPYFTRKESADIGWVMEPIDPRPYYAVCVDSLPARLQPGTHQYDVVIIDEAEQVFAHLLSATLQDKRPEALHLLFHYLRHATSLYVLDADLNRATVNILADCLTDRDRSWQFIVNQWRPNGRKLEVFENKAHLQEQLIAALDRKERCFVTSNSKKLLRELHRAVVARYGDNYRFIEIDGDNAQTKEHQAFISNIKTEILRYDCLFASPALGTGIDITFENQAQLVDLVIGFFEGRINTHFDIDQQLSRVRHPKRVCVWISPREFRFETSIDAIRSEIRDVAHEGRRFTGYGANGAPQYDYDELYQKIFAEITSLQRGSKNRLKKNLMDLRSHNGWEISVVQNDAARAARGRDLGKEGKALVWHRLVQEVLAARVITTSEYEELKIRGEFSQIKEKDQCSMRRYDLERFYRQSVTEDLLSLDDDGRYRTAVRRFELLATDDEELKRRDARHAQSLAPDRPYLIVQKRILSKLLGASTVLKDAGGIDAEVIVSAEMLAQFAGECLRYRRAIERLFDVPVRRDVLRKPTQQLGAILRLVGLKLDKGQTRKKGTGKQYFYILDAAALQALGEVVQKRAGDSSWNQDRAARELEDDVVVRFINRFKRKGQGLKQGDQQSKPAPRDPVDLDNPGVPVARNEGALQIRD